LIRPCAILRNEAKIISSNPNIFADGKTAIVGGSRSGGSARLEVGRHRIHRRERRRPGCATAQSPAAKTTQIGALSAAELLRAASEQLP
jgi:hypothetical protein